MQRLEVSGAVRPIYESLGVKRLMIYKAKDENNLRIFERQILRKIFGPVNTSNMWRIRNNMEIDKLIEGADMVRFNKAQRIKCLGHIQRMDQARPTRKLLDWKPVGDRPVGIPRQRWQENVMEDLKKKAESKKLEGNA